MACSPDLPKDPQALERRILEYAKEVTTAARQIDGLRFWSPAIRALKSDMKNYKQQPTAEKLDVILRRARGIGLNLGMSTGVRRGLDVDGRQFHKKAASGKALPGPTPPRKA